MLVSVWSKYGGGEVDPERDDLPWIEEGVLSVVSLATGAAQWELVPYPGTCVSAGYRGLAESDPIFFIDGDMDPGEASLRRLDRRSGAEVWRAPCPVEIWAVVRAADTVAFPSSTGVVAHAALDGAVQWQRNDLGRPVSLRAFSRLVVVIMTDRLVALDASTGSERWLVECTARADVDDDASSERLEIIEGRRHRLLSADGRVALELDLDSGWVLHRADGDLFLLSVQELVALDENGSERWRSPIPDAPSDVTSSMGDVVRHRDLVFVLNGEGQFAFDAMDGRLRWFHRNHEGSDAGAAADGLLWANGLDGLRVFDVDDGRELGWHRVAKPQFGGARPQLVGDSGALVRLSEDTSHLFRWSGG